MVSLDYTVISQEQHSSNLFTITLAVTNIPCTIETLERRAHNMSVKAAIDIASRNEILQIAETVVNDETRHVGYKVLGSKDTFGVPHKYFVVDSRSIYGAYYYGKHGTSCKIDRIFPFCMYQGYVDMEFRVYYTAIGRDVRIRCIGIWKCTVQTNHALKFVRSDIPVLELHNLLQSLR